METLEQLVELGADEGAEVVAVIMRRHPYYRRRGEPTIGHHVHRLTGEDVWTVKWRDFWGVKQDPDFGSKAEARARLARLLERCEVFVGTVSEFVELDMMWREMGHGAKD